MLTLFSIPKPFYGRVALIQRNVGVGVRVLRQRLTSASGESHAGSNSEY
jgi:hypothetical protein